ncbi:hypothetical protein BACCIP111895_01733 [Neobacillus rhizosphaerae]|uniref:DUF3147 family protein n=1 Tax=Neobacillus rhizosphaerae TaxID=2880965 RepID=A0ABM9EQZ2_9BACI|nr:DUF3147 family protein [Neobacillus rhizosphaerae]CAH2714561.1 hypothetical protein BACCIP111895_01733 [Neobacillus rhizosphaerae]
MYTIIKVIVSAIIIGIITEVARRFPTQGGIIAALPIVSILSIIWLYVQGEQMETLSKFALGVVWGIPATVVMLVIIGISLHNSLHLFVSLGLGMGGWLIFLFAQSMIVKLFV